MKVKLARSKYRTVMSEVLPYERPLFFTNKFFANLLKRYEIKISDGQLIPGRHAEDEGLNEFLRLIAGLISSSEKINYNYAISKDGRNKGRRLTIMHPWHQTQTMEFYERYSQLMIYFCNVSRFSIRYPWRIASKMKYSSTVEKIISDDAESEISPESAKSYFAYRKFSNISSFYDDYLFLNLERNFEYLLKVDIETCFDSINPDCLANLIYGENCLENFEKGEKDFIYDFIHLHTEIRNGLPANDEGKINGIIIGPEFSRLFAEIFLQQIDKSVENCLKEKHNLIPNIDYRICRYVDDSFIFANTTDSLKFIKDTYSQKLSEYDMKLKGGKMSFYGQRPFIDDLSLIKSRIRELINNTFENRLSTFIGFQKVQEGKYDAPTHLSFRSFVAELRVLVAETGFASQAGEEHSINSEERSKYKDITAFVLGVMQRRLLKLLQEFNNLYREYSQGIELGYISDKGAEIKASYEKGFNDFCIDLIESLFFILCSDFRMATAISVVKIIDIIQRFVRGKYIFDGDVRSMKFKSYVVAEIDEKVSKETLKVLRHKHLSGDCGLMEMLTLLELQHQMFPRNKISERAVLSFLKRVNAIDQLHFFPAFQIIHFTEGKNRYSSVLEYVRPWLENQCLKFIETGGNDTESLLTVLEILSMPDCYGIYDNLRGFFPDDVCADKVHKFLNKLDGFFIVWKNYSLAEELSARKGLNVY